MDDEQEEGKHESKKSQRIDGRESEREEDEGGKTEEEG